MKRPRPNRVPSIRAMLWPLGEKRTPMGGFSLNVTWAFTVRPLQRCDYCPCGCV